MIFGILNFLFTLVSLYLLQKYGRKKLLLLGQLMMWGANWLLFQIMNNSTDNSCSSNNIVIQIWIFILILWFLFSFAVTIGPICWIFLVEIMTEIGVGIAVSANWIVVILVSLIPIISKSVNENADSCDISFSFYWFSGMCILGFFLISLFVIETKDIAKNFSWYKICFPIYRTLVDFFSLEKNINTSFFF